jgi:hypothetical protein
MAAVALGTGSKANAEPHGGRHPRLNGPKVSCGGTISRQCMGCDVCGATPYVGMLGRGAHARVSQVLGNRFLDGDDPDEAAINLDLASVCHRRLQDCKSGHAARCSRWSSASFRATGVNDISNDPA